MTRQQDFTLKAYGEVLRAGLDAGYRFVGYTDIGREGATHSCILRHDIDAEIFACEPMLEVEADLGIRATYFLMTRSTTYNLFCIDALRVVERILERGHSIGLHYMGELLASEPAERLIEHVLEEANWLESEFGRPLNAVSFHQPSKAVLEGELRVGALVNTYNRQQMADYFYVSDTNMHWRHAHPIDIFTAHSHARLQLLIHPIWWTQSAVSLEEKWLRVLRSQAEATIQHWQKRERTLEGIALAERFFGRNGS